MNYHTPYAICAVLLFLCASLSGCVAPPKEIPPITPTPSGGDSSTQYSDVPNPPVAVTTTVGYLKDATPFPTRVTPTYVNQTPVPTPTVNPDRVCLIYFTQFNAPFAVKNTAKEFSLKNPPMYINYTITNPYYITGTKIGPKKYANIPETVTYKTLNPVAYLEITARNRTTGTIYTQDGFGRDHGLYLNKTIKITKADDLLIEFGGYNVTSTIGVWVKPAGNFGENDTFTQYECKNPSDFGPNIITTITPS